MAGFFVFMAAEVPATNPQYRQTIQGVDSVTLKLPTNIAVNPSTHAMLIEGSISATNPSVGEDGQPVPNYSTQIGFEDGSGNLTNVSASNPLPATATLAKDPIPATGLSEAVVVQIVDGSGNQVSSFGGGTQYTNGDAEASPIGTVALGYDGSNVRALLTDASGNLQAEVINTVTISGTVTANAGTNLNTSALLTSANFAAAFGTAGSPDTQVMTIQGISSMTPILIEGTIDAGSPTGSPVPANAVYMGLNGPTGDLVGAQTVSVANGQFDSGLLAAGVMGVSPSDFMNYAVAADNVSADGTASSISLFTKSQMVMYNGATWDRVRGNTTDGLLVNLGSNNDITGTVAVSSVIPGTGATNLGKAEDAGHTTADVGVFALGVRNDTMADVTNTDADYSQISVDLKGRTITTNAPRARKITQTTTITSSTSETTVLTAAASTYHDVYGVIVTNSSATQTEVAFKDDTGGTTRFTIAVPAGDTRGFMLPIDAAWNQGATNDNWTATCADSVASILISVFAVKNT